MINGDIMLKKYKHPEGKYCNYVLHEENGKPALCIFRGGKTQRRIEEKDYDTYEEALLDLDRKEKLRLQHGYERVS